MGNGGVENGGAGAGEWRGGAGSCCARAFEGRRWGRIVLPKPLILASPPPPPSVLPAGSETSKSGMLRAVARATQLRAVILQASRLKPPQRPDQSRAVLQHRRRRRHRCRRHLAFPQQHMHHFPQAPAGRVALTTSYQRGKYEDDHVLMAEQDQVRQSGNGLPLQMSTSRSASFGCICSAVTCPLFQFN